MNLKKILPFFTLFIFTNVSFSQDENFGIVFPATKVERAQTCTDCFNAFRQKPSEVQFSIENVNGNLYFETNSKEWASQVFNNPKDGLAIDVVTKDMYNCSSTTNFEDKQIKGILLKPVYSQQLNSGFKPSGKNKFRVLVGKVPQNLRRKDLEYNILFLGNNTLCRYQVIFNLKNYKWDLLDMGVYLKAISLKDERLIIDEEDTIVRYKSLRFKIPFEKNKSVYSPKDIKPVYDSLNITDFNIKTIDIKAYSSLEGRTDRNVQLQKRRASSIAKAVQTYQRPTIKTTISTSENWVEFLNDIKGTAYADLKNLRKSEIKDKLVGEFSREMEPILENHRKAIIVLELVRKDRYDTMTPNQLVALFNSRIAEDKQEDALTIQNSIFEKIKNKKASIKILKELKIPQELKYIDFLNNNSAIKYHLNERQIIIVRDELVELQKMAPNNAKIKYNLAAIKLKIWRYNIEDVNPERLKSNINNLERFQIPKESINRLLVNFYITRAENYNRKRDYRNKDKAVTELKRIYKKITLTDSDYFSLAQFLSYYDSVESAAELLSIEAKKIDVDQDLLFYYLNLTLLNEDLTKTDDYRTIMFNAANLNNKRYCNIFNTPDKDGVTFQLLEDSYLRDSYCENCAN